MSETLIWIGIAICLLKSATFSGLNLAVFSLSRLRLEAFAETGDRDAIRILAFRRDANYTLVTILLGNVAINVLLTLLAESALAGVTAFLFSTVVITLFGEVIPQAYFSRHALRVASLFSPLLRFYRVLLWPVARPVGRLLDAWVGPEGIPWFREREMHEILRHHARSDDTELSRVEATGAINFLALDDLAVGREGEPLHPDSVVSLEMEDGRPRLPQFERTPDDPFLRRLDSSGKKWVVISDPSNEPRSALDAHGFLRDAIFGGSDFNPEKHFHRPLILKDASEPLGRALSRFTVEPEGPEDDVIDRDLLLVWTPEERRIITGSDLLGRLLRGIARNPAAPDHARPAPGN
jgi:metal transporter CNNM